MAEGNEQSNWWGSWINSAKTKSASMLEAVKKDLGELSTAVKTEASNIAESLKIDEPDSTANNVKKSISTFFGQVTEALIPSIEDEDTEAILITNDGSITLTGFQKHLAELQQNDETYLVEPSNELQGKYKRWLEVIEQDQFTEPRLAKHLTSSVILNEKYINLVPEKISHMEFWKRYLFKKALLEDALANAEMAEKRSKIEINQTAPVVPNKVIVQTTQPKKIVSDDEILEIKKDQIIEEMDEEILRDNELKWLDNNDFIDSNVDLTEEEQARLLAEYELEVLEREKKVYNKKDNVPEIASTEPVKKNQNKKALKQPQQKQKTTTTTNLPSKSETSTKKPSTTVPANNDKNNKQNNNKKQQQQQQQKKQPQTSTTSQAVEATTTTSPEAAASSSANIIIDNKIFSDNSLTVDKDHFKKDDKEEIASSNSDESWEKEFDLDE